MRKFVPSGLAQSMARELAPEGLHVAHFLIDGGISRGAHDPRRERGADGLLDPIAETCLHVHGQRAAPGPGKSNCARGSRRFDASASLPKGQTLAFVRATRS
jgi:hypothetical protein